MAPLKAIALISGGKDSLFSILHCLAHGHEVVALANLYPPSSSDDEDINSYMYQTVGHSIIPLYEQALEIPLYRQEIAGNAVNSKRDYSVPQANEAHDETESLLPLLNKIVAAHPEANAVSTGAILSTYQRTRVESIALRLGLTPLSYLWQYPILPPYKQSNLLYDMAAVGQEAIIIKTASGGLDETFLGLNVADHKTVARLSKAMGRFGEDSIGAILGEGGEFETLALDGPALLWKKRIDLQPAPVVVQDGGTAIYKTKASTLAEKRPDRKEIALKDLRVPDLFDDEFKKIRDELYAGDTARSGPHPTTQDSITTAPDGDLRHTWDSLHLKSYSDTPTVFTYNNLTGYEKERVSASPQRQLTVILLQLDYILKQWKLSSSSINHCTLLLRDMADFTLLNPIYGKYFSYTNPPARVTVAVGNAMPQPYDVMLSIVIDKDTVDKDQKTVMNVDRQGLHVQSRSYWAPANIGPYSQAISSKLPGDNERAEESHFGVEVVYVAGQIPLIPASMEVYQVDGFRGQAVLSLQHLWRIGRAKSVRWWTSGVAMIADIQNPDECVKTAQTAWKAIHSQPNDDQEEDDENVEVDPWDRLNKAPSFNDNTVRAPIPDHSSIRPSGNNKHTPPCFVVQVSSLPRAVNIEWCATGLTSSSITYDSNINDGPITLTAPAGTRTRFYTVEITSAVDIIALKQIGEASITGWTCATLYAGPELGQVWEEARKMVSMKGVQWVPCFKVWGEEAREIKGVLVGRVDREEV